MTCRFHMLLVGVLASLTAMSPAPAQDKAAVASVPASGLTAFLKTHKGPVLDVRMQGDCDDSRRLRKPADTIGFDFGPDNADARKMAREMFLGKVKASKALSTASKQKQTVLVVCCAGGRSEAAAALLAENGFKVAHLTGGMQSEEIPAALLKAKK